MDEEKGHRILAKLCEDELDQLKQKGVCEAQLSPTEKYALYHGVRHTLQLDENARTPNLDKWAQIFLSDLELLYPMLCVKDSTTVEEILLLQSQELPRSLSAERKDFLDNLIILLQTILKFFRRLFP